MSLKTSTRFNIDNLEYNRNEMKVLFEEMTYVLNMRTLKEFNYLIKTIKKHYGTPRNQDALAVNY